MCREECERQSGRRGRQEPGAVGEKEVRMDAASVSVAASRGEGGWEEVRKIEGQEGAARARCGR